MKTHHLWFYASLIGATLLITLWRTFGKPMRIPLDRRDTTILVSQPTPAPRNDIDEKQIFAFVQPELDNCDDLFEVIQPASLEYDGEYRHLSGLIAAEWARMKARKVSLEGHSGNMLKQKLTYQTIAKATFVKTVCETGFNAGHSALVFLATKANIHVYSFDLGSHKYARPMANLLQKAFPGRLNITWGDSKLTVPAFSKSHPDIKCDILIVDGGHKYREAKADLRNLRAMAQKSYHILIIDDHPANSLPGVKRAWKEELSAQQLKEHFGCTFNSKKNRGFTVGKYMNL